MDSGPAPSGASRNDEAEWGRRTTTRHTFSASGLSGSRLLPQTTNRDCDTFRSMKTKNLSEILERIEAWPPEAQNELAEIVLERDAGLSNGEDRPTPEELARDRRLRDLAETGKRQYASIKDNLERDHFGAYVMINTDTCDYVVGSTITQVHTAFIERFGEDAPGWSTRIGVPIFASI
jgi:hypothetical protein